MTAPAPAFPFSALVGQDALREALLCCAVDPRIGGVLVRGERGTAKSTAVRGLAPLLPPVRVVAGSRYASDPDTGEDSPDGRAAADAAVVERPVALVELPIGATADRLLGTLDLDRALADGAKAFEPGLLAAAHRGILYVDEVNLLPDHLVDVLLDAAAMGRVHIERDGLSASYPARFLLVGTMNPEEGDLRPQLLDRFGLSVTVAASADPAERTEVVRRRLAYDADPAAFAARFGADEGALAARVRAARDGLAQVRLPERVLLLIAGTCARLGVDGMRADIVCARAACALAALDGAGEVREDHVRRAALLALAHRRRRGPLEAPGLDPEELDGALAETAAEQSDGGFDPDDDPSGGGNGHAGNDARPVGAGAAPAPANGSASGAGASGDGAGAVGDGAGAGASGDGARAPSAAAASPAATTFAAAAPARERTETPAAPGAAPLLALAGRGRGATGRRSRADGPHGQPVDSRPPDGPVRDLALAATLGAAALRRAGAGADGAGGDGRLTHADLREHFRAGREGNLVAFCVDASGSMGARRRMAAVKGAVLGLLLDAYQRRDRVALVAFRGAAADLVLPPTASVERAAAALAGLATGGGTPLATGLERTAALIAAERRRDPDRRALALVVTDGRASGGAAGRDAAARAAVALGRAADGVAVFDAEEGAVRLGLAGALARAAGARLLPLAPLDPAAPPGAAARGRSARRARSIPTALPEGRMTTDHENRHAGPGVDVPHTPEDQGSAEPKRRKPRDRPLLIVLTGHGKGKSTSAFGMLMRSWARGYRCGVFQFVKGGKWKVGEAAAARELGGIDWEKMGDGWTWISRDLDQSADLARAGWEGVKQRIADERYEFVLLDEITYPINYGWIDEADVVATLRNRPGFQHVVATGRDAPAALVEAADLVSEVVKVKHPMDVGIRAQQGIEW